MYCARCGAKIEENEKFCGACGTPVTPVTPPVVSQRVVEAVPQQAPARVKKSGISKAGFVVGLISCILIILQNLPLFLIAGTMFVIGPLAMILGASNGDDLFGYGLLIALGSLLLTGAAVVSIVLNICGNKITAKRHASKCRKFRMVSAILAVIDSAITLAPVIGTTDLMSGLEFFYAIFVIAFVLAVVFLVLTVITNTKEKKSESDKVNEVG